MLAVQDRICMANAWCGSIKKYYDGFLGQLDANLMSTVESAAKKLFSHLGLRSGRNLKMLDIGGGGGFFSKAFEDLGYGESTYVDLDPQSRNFARDNLKLEKVLNYDPMKMEHVSKNLRRGK